MIKLDYEAAPPEESLAAARQVLANLYDLPLPKAGEGTCDDCGRTRVLLEFGRLRLCGGCARHRQRAGEKAAA